MRKRVADVYITLESPHEMVHHNYDVCTFYHSISLHPTDGNSFKKCIRWQTFIRSAFLYVLRREINHHFARVIFLFHSLAVRLKPNYVIYCMENKERKTNRFITSNVIFYIANKHKTDKI